MKPAREMTATCVLIKKGKYRLGPIGIIVSGSAFIFWKYGVKSHEVQHRLEHIVRCGQFFTPFIQRVGE